MFRNCRFWLSLFVASSLCPAYACFAASESQQLDRIESKLDEVLKRLPPAIAPQITPSASSISNQPETPEILSRLIGTWVQIEGDGELKVQPNQMVQSSRFGEGRIAGSTEFGSNIRVDAVKGGSCFYRVRFLSKEHSVWALLRGSTTSCVSGQMAVEQP